MDRLKVMEAAKATVDTINEDKRVRKEQLIQKKMSLFFGLIKVSRERAESRARNSFDWDDIEIDNTTQLIIATNILNLAKQLQTKTMFVNAGDFIYIRDFYEN